MLLGSSSLLLLSTRVAKKRALAWINSLFIMNRAWGAILLSVRLPVQVVESTKSNSLSMLGILFRISGRYTLRRRTSSGETMGRFPYLSLIRWSLGHKV